LRHALQEALDESLPRKVQSVIVVIRSNRGETRSFTFRDLKTAIDFMRSSDEEGLLDMTSAPALLMDGGKPPKKSRQKGRSSERSA